MQNGNIVRHGRWWILRYRKTVLVNGKPKRERVVQKLHLIDDQHRHEGSVRELAAKYLAPVNAGDAPESVDTVGNFLDNVYLPYIKEKADLTPSTIDGYRRQLTMIQRHTSFCALPIHKITTADVHDVLETIAAEGTRDGRQRGRRSLKNVRNFLSGAFKYAVNKRLVTTNPVREAITPKGARPKETHANTLPEIFAMLAALKEEPAHTLCLAAALTGLSQSELSALQWDDIRDGHIYVRRASWRGKISRTKTEAREKGLPLLPIVRDALDELKAKNGFHQWVFHGETGQPILMDNYNARVIRPTLRTAGIKWHGWHAMRRGIASNLVELGADPKIAQAILRHANVRTTLEHYIKARPEKTAAAMTALEAAFKKGQEDFERKQKAG